MKNQQGFSLIELLIVVAIIAVIAAIAVPSLLQAKMAANEAGAIQGCRTVGSAQVAFAAVNNQQYDTLGVLVTGNFLDSRFDPAGSGFNGYIYDDISVTPKGGAAVAIAPGDSFSVTAAPSAVNSSGRYTYGVTTDQIVRYVANTSSAADPSCGAAACTGGEPIGTKN